MRDAVSLALVRSAHKNAAACLVSRGACGVEERTRRPRPFSPPHASDGGRRTQHEWPVRRRLAALAAAGQPRPRDRPFQAYGSLSLGVAARLSKALAEEDSLRSSSSESRVHKRGHESVCSSCGLIIAEVTLDRAPTLKAHAPDTHDRNGEWACEVTNNLRVDKGLHTTFFLSVPGAEWSHGNARDVFQNESVVNVQPLVKVRGRSNEADLAGTLFHEYAHTLLHVDPDDAAVRSKREGEAEAVAFVVSRYAGLKMSGLAFYLGAWDSDDPELVRDQLDRISRTSEGVIEVLKDWVGVPPY